MVRSPVSYVPAAQIAHALWPVAGWRHPDGQLSHALERPVCALYVPAAQLVHAAAPVCALYVPAGQLVHVASAAVVAPVGPYLPAAHAVPVHDLAWSQPSFQPAPLCRPAGQFAQALQERAPPLGPRGVRGLVQGQYAWLPTWYWPAPHPSIP